MIEELNWTELKDKNETPFWRARPTPGFWEYWRANKEELRRRKVYVGKFGSEWMVTAFARPFLVHGEAVPDEGQGQGPVHPEGEALPAWVEAKLRPWQINHARGIRAALERGARALDASDTGTGKTVVALAVMAAMGRPFIVVSPLSVVPAWRRMGKEMFGLNVRAVNYEAIRTGRQDQLVKRTGNVMEWQLPKETVIIFDEAHRLKSPTSLQAKLGLAAAYQGYTVLMLSATLADNPLDMRACGALLGLHGGTKASFYRFAGAQGCVQGQWGWKFVGGPKTLARLHAKIFPGKGSRMRIKELGDKFPETIISAEAYDPGKEVRVKACQVYEEMEACIRTIEASSSSDKASCILTAQLRARQRVEALRLPLLTQLVEDGLDEGSSVVVFVNFSDTLESLEKTFKGKCVVIHGGQTLEQRQAAIDAFQADLVPVCICNIKAGGVGVSLHGARHRLALISPTYSAQELVQALGRVRRDGGGKSTQKIVFFSGTIEEEACKAVRAKIDCLESLNDGELSER